MPVGRSCCLGGVSCQLEPLPDDEELSLACEGERWGGKGGGGTKGGVSECTESISTCTDNICSRDADSYPIEVLN